MFYLDKFYTSLKGSMDLLEKACTEVYEAYKRETDVLKRSELRYLLRMLENADGYNYATLYGHLAYVMSQDRQEGTLHLNSNGRFTLGKSKINEFTSGEPIELYIDKHEDYDEPGWYFGRVEYRGNGYYFFSYQGEPIDLKPGMKAARRTTRSWA
ncbi:hypothetical protein Desaci_4139 [Desulfosporosinus acidiphilus SJ4]|uniref:DUF5348 domain-containing protein n=1 Tax=Desulfosporosinus acidiphilus (strain DSM 22704 / JCM 16185 / SJ4) TaxID=646529 RepID=I4DB27_DESAJ|nr:DUF5348 domain-containing protein [Desulfosporosinus acidiphilus]AFM43001.1 hypothetical protein Desaci_4139 [Desulfosporosinus acidiphilus SJ4]